MGVSLSPDRALSFREKARGGFKMTKQVETVTALKWFDKEKNREVLSLTVVFTDGSLKAIDSAMPLTPKGLGVLLEHLAHELINQE